jgi:beta-N-acetylhexosaminidase
MSLEEKIGQLIMVRSYAEFQNAQSPAYLELREQMSKYHIGSVILTVRSEGAFLQRGQPFEAAAVVNQLQRDAKYPLLVAADFERGLSMRFFAAPVFPHAMAFSATPDPIGNEERFAAIVARESRAIGVHWNFFPVTDVNVNPENPIINIRSFGEDPQQIGSMAAAYVRGSHAGGMLATAKHFPGHGDTDQDTHINLARVNAPRERLDQVELVPFKAAIDAGVDSVMIAHVSAPALDPTNTSAGLSRPIVHDLLQQQMGFRGLTVTDALEMQGIASAYGNAPDAPAKITLDAILAGNDLALLPANVDLAYNALLNAARSGQLSEAEIDARVRKILSAKAAMGLSKNRLVDLEKLRNLVARPEDTAFAQQVADTSVTLVRNDNQAIPLLRQARNPGTVPPPAAYQIPGGVFALIAVEDMRSDWGRAFERELRARVPNARVLYVDSRNAGAMMEAVTQATIQAQSVIIAAYAIPVSGAKIQTNDGIKGATSIQMDISGAIERILQIAPDRTAFVSLGNPYLASRYQPKTYVTTYSNVPTSEAAAVKALLGEIEFQGKLPVTIPGYAKRRDGLTIPKQ